MNYVSNWVSTKFFKLILLGAMSTFPVFKNIMYLKCGHSKYRHDDNNTIFIFIFILILKKKSLRIINEMSFTDIDSNLIIKQESVVNV